MGNWNWKITEEEYKEVINEANSLYQQKEEGKDVNSIIKEYLKGELIEMTDEEVETNVDAFINNSSKFTEAIESEEDIDVKIEEHFLNSIKEMTTEQAIKCLETIKYTLELSSASAVQKALSGDVTINSDSIEQELKDRVEANASVNDAERIDKLVAEIMSFDDSLLMMISGNEQLLENVNDTNRASAAEISRIVNAKFESSEEKAILSAVVFSHARNGTIEGIPNDVEASIVSIFVNAGIEKSKVIQALVANEIDEAKASSLLEKIGKVVKFLLLLAVEFIVMYTMTSLVISLLAPLIVVGPITAGICIGLGLLVGFDAMELVSEDIVEGITNFCNSLYNKAIKPASEFIKKVFTNAKDAVKNYSYVNG